MMSYSLMTTIGPHFSYCQQKKTLNKILTIPPSLPAPYRRSSIAPVVNVVGSINPEIRKNEDKVVDSIVVSELSKPLTAYCRCWRSESFPQCDGSHTKHNKATGDNIGPLLVKKKPSVAAVVPNGHLPMRSFEVKNRTSVDDIKSLRLITAIKTPYLPDGRFDLEAYDALMNTHIMNGTEGVIVGGTTGEGHLMSWDEHIMLIGHTVNCFGTRIKVIGNTGSNSTREAIHATEQGFAVGMHAALHINPYYGKTSLQGMLLHFETILSMGPTIIYNVPSRTGQDIPPSVINKISSNHNLAGIKECVGNDRIKEYVDGGMTIWSGNDDECHDARWAYGAVGVISVTSNLIPGLMHELMFEGENVSLNSKVMPLIKWLFDEPNPIGLNTALAQLGVIRPVFRLPYVPLPLSKRVEFVSIVESIGREHFVGDGDVEVLDDNDFVLVGRY